MLHSSLCVFPLFEKLLFIKLDKSSTAFYLLSLLNFFSRQKLTQFQSIKISGVLLNRISIASSIHRETFCLADRSSTDSRSIEVGICSIAARQLLDLSGPSYMHCFFFFTCFASFYYLVIHSILFHYIHAFIWIPCAP